jgi:hypothetical protein
MKNLLSIAAITAFTLGGVCANAGELPSYKVMGFPISPHQLSVLGISANIEEQSPSSLLTLTMAGMPASPHQVAVLTPRPRGTNGLGETNRIAETISTR